MMKFLPEGGSPLDRLASFMVVNLLWLSLAILVIPLPAATAGLFAVVAHWVRGRDVEVFATFFGTMRRQWRKSTLIGLADAILLGIIAVNFYAFNLMPLDTTVLWVLRGGNVFVAVVTLMMNMYLWPLLVLFDLPVLRLLNLSWRFAFGYAPWSFFVVFIVVLLLLLGFVVSALLVILFGASATALIVNWGAWRILRKHATPEELAELDKPTY